MIPSVYIEEYTSEAETGYEPLHPLVSKFGRHIEEISLELPEAMRVQDYSRELHKCLECLPNIRLPDIYGNLPEFDGQEVPTVNVTDSLVKVRRQLKTLKAEFRHDNYKVCAMARFLRPYFVNITALCVGIGREFLWPPNINVGFPNLKDLEMKIGSTKLAERFFSQLQSSHCPPKLRKLTLETHTFGPETTNQLLAMINKFGATLQYLELKGDS